jgi:pimeloyl-ACP methyl ester carboxylesterase/DNA-binding SARP family transcriptional activator
VFHAGEPLSLPASKKTRALLAYLVLTGREHTRDRLCTLLFPDVDDPRAALRWSLSRLRPIAAADGRERLVADRDVVRFHADAAEVDALAVRRLLARDAAQVGIEALADAAAAFEGPLLAGLDLPDAPEFHGWCIAERERFRKVEREVLDRLVEQLHEDAEAAVPYAERRARLDPQDDAAHARLITVLGAAGRSREADAQFRAHRRWLEAHGSRPGPEFVRAWAALAGKASPPSSEPVTPMGQEVRFCRSSDGTSIAYATSGSGPPLVKAANWMSHLEYEWRSPIWRHWMRELSGGQRLVRYDQRANGLSDWAAEDLSLEAFVDDLDAVVAAAGVTQYPVLGISQGGAIAIAHAIRHPEQVTALVLYGAWARGWRKRGKAEDLDTREAMLTLMLHGWGRPNAAFRQMFTSLFCPGATREQMEAFNELQRECASPENAMRLSNAAGDFDVTALLPHVRAPTLVLHARDDAVVPFDEGRRLAVGIPGARFVPLDAKNHILLEEDAAWPAFLTEVREFLSAVERRGVAAEALPQT